MKKFLLGLSFSLFAMACPPGQYLTCEWVDIGPGLGFNRCYCVDDPTAPPSDGPCQICYDCSSGFCLAVPCSGDNKVSIKVETDKNDKSVKTTKQTTTPIRVVMPKTMILNTNIK